MGAGQIYFEVIHLGHVPHAKGGEYDLDSQLLDFPEVHEEIQRIAREAAEVLDDEQIKQVGAGVVSVKATRQSSSSSPLSKTEP